MRAIGWRFLIVFLTCGLLAGQEKDAWPSWNVEEAARHTTFLPTCTGPYQVTAGDLNGDGYPDLVIPCRGELLSPSLKRPANDRLTVYLNHGSGAKWERRDFPVGFGPYTAAIADLDGDGIPDAAVADYQSNDGRDLAILYGSKDRAQLFEPTRYIRIEGKDFFNEKGLTSTGEPRFAAPGLTSLAIGDFNGDGRPDIIAVAYQSDFLVVLLNQGGRKFKQVRYPRQPEPWDVVSAGPRDVVLADFDGDGITDFAITLYATNLIEVWRGDGKGHFSLWRRTPSFGVTPYHLKAADLDGDGRPEIIVGNRAASDNVVVLRNGRERFSIVGSFQPGTPRQGETTADEIREVYLTDLDRDGKADLIAACHVSNKVVFWKGTGDLAYGKAFTGRRIVEFPGKGPRAIARLPDALAIVFYNSSEIGILPLPSH